MRKILVLFLMIFAVALCEEGTEKNIGKGAKISGYMFGDAYWVTANHDSAIVNSDGFWFRRIYLTIEKKIYSDLDVRVRLEMASSGDFNEKATLIVPFIKDAWLRWKYAENHSLYLGISEPPSIRVVEKYWGKRYLEKTPEDLQKTENSRDFGVAFRGKITPLKGLKYHLMIGNGSGNKSEINSGKKMMASLYYTFSGGWVVDLYGDYNDNNGIDDYYSWHLFGAYQGKRTGIGFLYSEQNHLNGGSLSYRFRVLSGYLTWIFREHWSLILRADRNMDPNPRGDGISYIPFDPTASNTLLIAGIEFHPIEDFRLTPNLEVVVYDENETGVTPGDDVIPRLTFFFEF